MSFRSQFVTDLHKLDLAETRTRLRTVRAAVDRRLDELESLKEPALRTDLLIANDEVSSSLMATARHGIERLATALAVSHGEPAQPSAYPRVPNRSVRS
ncbi:hypothetical protein FV222_14015 [Methylobacterium sp. WL103]|uniref:Uncharacterized protein n=1 Tax=Methylobacterium trifolii TaxID=1003092 RepID=A0ABQ4TXZ7_9HYPH|nr:MULTISPECIES: hypothetical protein [Methylobacterium]TXM98716.1 hypothetical protein FV222_14015 [Methylobacterium sp. WL103]GJE59784.1 hypothetical protein MPOCJGCO_1886 [Methylobacterium trifolii]